MQLQFLARVELFLNGLTRAELLFFDTQFLPLCEIRLKAVDAQIT